MKIAIISDTHDNILNTKTALDYINGQKCDVLFHCGDLAHSETGELFCSEFKNPIYLVGGNADLDFDEIKKLTKKYQHLTYEEKKLICTIDSITFLLTHKDIDALLYARQEKVEYIFYGHTHKPWAQEINEVQIINPGNICDTRYPATFAIFNTTSKKIELIQIAKIKNQSQ